MSLVNNNGSNKLTLNRLLFGFLIITSSFLSLSNLMPLSANAQTTTSSSSQNLSNSPGNSTDAQIAVNQNNVYVLWSDVTAGNKDIYFKRSVDNGTSLGSTENLSNSPGNSTDAQIAVSQNNVYVSWSDGTTGNGDIYFKRSVDNGTSFGNTENLSNSTGNSTDAQIAVNQNNVYVIWTDNTTGNGDIYFKRSANNGTSFGNTENLSNDIGNSYEPQIVISGNNVYVVWIDNTTGNGDIY